MYSQIYVYIGKYLYIAKNCGVGRALNRRATSAAHFNWGGSLALGVDRFRGALELPETWEIGGPTRPREHLSRSASADRFTRPRHPFEPVVHGHPLWALRASQHGHYRRFLDQGIYILSSVTLDALATLIRRGNATTKKCSVVGGSRNPMMLTSERRRIEDLIATISYAEFRRELGPECQH